MSTTTITAAVAEAQDAYENAEKNPFDHGFAMITGLDGRTKLAKDLKDHRMVTVDTGGYHGTTATIRGISRYAGPSEKAYRAFLAVLEENGYDRAADASVFVNRN